jgi:hypothetical protein
MRRRYLASILALGIVGGLLASDVQATEGGASLYLPGLRGPLAGVVPPPGFYCSND